MNGERENLWMHIHEVATSLEDAGLTRDERMRTALAELDGLPPIVRRQLLQELTLVASELLDLQPLAVAAMNQSESSPLRPAEAG